jgi:hypothetical protein
MRKVRFILLVMGAASAAFSQQSRLTSPNVNQVDPGNSQLSPAIQNAIGNVRANLAPDLPGGAQQHTQQILRQVVPPQLRPCSVPLLQMQIRDDVHFTGEILKRPTERLDPMPHTAVPAPACGSTPR